MPRRLLLLFIITFSIKIITGYYAAPRKVQCNGAMEKLFRSSEKSAQRDDDFQ